MKARFSNARRWYGNLGRPPVLGLVAAVFLAAMGSTGSNAADGGVSGEWVDGHASRVRIVAGRSTNSSESAHGGIIAGVEIELQPGWKTYWRFPGEAGGVPPHFDWSKSTNVADAKVLFPAPKRLSQDVGDTIGYKDHIVLPVLVETKDDGKPVLLDLEFSFGVCRDICIPAEASLKLAVPSDVAAGVPSSIGEALDHVPRAKDQRRAGDPELAGHTIVLDGKNPHIVLEIDFGSKPGKGDVFAEAPDGLYLPMAKKIEANSGAPGAERFLIDLTQTVDLADLKGKTITLTLVSKQGQSERKLRLE